MDLATLVVVCASTAVLGYVAGRWHGYVDAKPKRDNTGRFKKKG